MHMHVAEDQDSSQPQACSHTFNCILIYANKFILTISFSGISLCLHYKYLGINFICILGFISVLKTVPWCLIFYFNAFNIYGHWCINMLEYIIPTYLMFLLMYWEVELISTWVVWTYYWEVVRELDLWDPCLVCGWDILSTSPVIFRIS